MFRSVRFFRLSSAWPESDQALSQLLSSAEFEPCGAWSEASSGWESPAGDADVALSRRVNGADLLRLRTQARLLPRAAIEDALEARINEYRERAGEEPTRSARRKLREQTRDELLPKAFVRSQRTSGFVIPSEGIVAVDTLSDTRAEHFLEHLRAPLGELDVAPLTFGRPVGELLMRIFLGDTAGEFAPGGECRMCDPADSRATIRCIDIDLADANVRNHVREGMRLTHLGIEFNSVLGCTLDENGGISKLRLVGMDNKEDFPDEDPLARLDAEFALLTGTMRQLLGALKKALGGYAGTVLPAPLAATG
jgi:recombination associated protein RdgC